MRAAIIDDEFLARKRLADLLEDQEDVQLVGQAKNGEEALALIRLKAPDVIFLDIKMPKIDGFQLLQKLDKIPLIIFTTAHDEFAIRAFESEAVDYLLKPFDEERLHKAVSLCLKRIEQAKSSDFAEKLQYMVRSFQAEKSRYLDRLQIKEKGRYLTILLDDVLYLEAEGNYVKLVLADVSKLYRVSMNKLVEELNPEQYLRVHRSFIVNAQWVQGYKYVGNNEYQISLSNGQVIQSGRAYKEEIDAFLGG